jgi:hypothetical protein
MRNIVFQDGLSLESFASGANNGAAFSEFQSPDKE